MIKNVNESASISFHPKRQEPDDALLDVEKGIETLRQSIALKERTISQQQCCILLMGALAAISGIAGVILIVTTRQC